MNQWLAYQAIRSKPTETCDTRRASDAFQQKKATIRARLSAVAKIVAPRSTALIT
jgi:hypothetical protein